MEVVADARALDPSHRCRDAARGGECLAVDHGGHKNRHSGPIAKPADTVCIPEVVDRQPVRVASHSALSWNHIADWFQQVQDLERSGLLASGRP